MTRCTLTPMRLTTPALCLVLPPDVTPAMVLCRWSPLPRAEHGETYVWGNGGNGRLGIGTVDHQVTPRLLTHAVGGRDEPIRFVDAYCGDFHTLAVGGECPLECVFALLSQAHTYRHTHTPTHAHTKD